MIIYKVTCLINNKVYIGKTIGTLPERKRHHLNDTKIIKNSSIFHKAIRKYGADNFCWEILNRIMFSDLLLELEKFYIKKYNSKTPYGYNLTDGGEGMAGFRPSIETRRKISIAGMGRPVSQETRNKISQSEKGKFVSEEIKAKMRKPKTKKHRRNLSISKKNKKGHSVSAESKNKISIANKGKRPWNYGLKMPNEYRSEETKKKISIALKSYFKKNKEDL